MHLRGRSVGDVDGHVGVLEGFPEVAALVLAGIVDVAIGIDLGRLRSDRLFQIDDVREDLVVDLDECDGLLRDLGIVRSDGGHFVAHELHLVAEERLLAAELDLRRVKPVQHRAHAREGLRLLRVDGAHARAGHRAAENGRVQHARQPNVLRVHRAAGDAVAAVDARSGATDLRSWRAVA